MAVFIKVKANGEGNEDKCNLALLVSCVTSGNVGLRHSVHGITCFNIAS
jgi:hypothetical protein